MSGYSQIVYRVGFQEAYHHVIEVELWFSPKPEAGASKTATLGTAPQAQHAEITVEGGTDSQGLELVFPVWTPGSYMVREYTRNIETLTASEWTAIDGEMLRPLALRRHGKNRFSIARAGSHSSSVCVRYRLY